jgi:hypothetical protein
MLLGYWRTQAVDDGPVRMRLSPQGVRDRYHYRYEVPREDLSRGQALIEMPAVSGAAVWCFVRFLYEAGRRGLPAVSRERRLCIVRAAKELRFLADGVASEIRVRLRHEGECNDESQG